MLTPEENEALCRVGPDTPMGKLLRRYWVPAFQLGDLPEPDCAPIKVTILGEDFVAFRDTEGKIGFLDELCPHRGASLVLGRVEDCGIRCLYHGWKYAVDGTILETPNMKGSRFAERVKHGSYPVRESGGLGWVYLGPAGTEPPFPTFPWDAPTTDDVEVGASEMVMDCNWMQVLEGSIDSSHVGVLHLDTLAVMGAGPCSVGTFDFPGDPWDHDMPTPPRGKNPWPSHDNAPVIEVEDTPFGFHYAAVRDSADDPNSKYVRITAFVMPYTAFVGGSAGAVIVVPRDDYTCSSFGVFRAPKGSGAARRSGIDPSIWGPEPENRRMRLPAQDREAMKSGRSFAGFKGGNRVQDGAVQMSSGRMYDRAKEHLVPADLAIIRLRRLLADSIRLVEEGKPPVGLGVGYDFTNIKGASALIDANTPWQDLVPDHLGTSEEATGVGS